MSGRIEAVFFDLDDTLFDRRRAQVEVLRLLMEQFQDVFAGVAFEPAFQAFRESDRLALAEFNASRSAQAMRAGRAAKFLGLLGRPAAKADEIAAAYVKAHSGICCPVAGARETVRLLAERFAVGVITNGLPDLQHEKLRGLGLDGSFACVLVSGEGDVWKPMPEIFRLGAARLAKEPAACLYVGDDYRMDVAGASAAGMRACWFNAGRRPAPETPSRADCEVAALAEIPGLGILRGCRG